MSKTMTPEQRAEYVEWLRRKVVRRVKTSGWLLLAALVLLAVSIWTWDGRWALTAVLVWVLSVVVFAWACVAESVRGKAEAKP